MVLQSSNERENAGRHMLLPDHILVRADEQETCIGICFSTCGKAWTRYSTPFSVANRAAMPINALAGMNIELLVKRPNIHLAGRSQLHRRIQHMQLIHVAGSDRPNARRNRE